MAQQQSFVGTRSTRISRLLNIMAPYGSPEDVPQSDNKDMLLQTRPSPRADVERTADSTKKNERRTRTGLVSPLTATSSPHLDVNDVVGANNAKIALARERIKRSYADSNLGTEVVLPRFRFDHVALGKELGTGGFSTVYEVCKINADCVEKKNERQQTKRPRRKKRSSRFSLKRLSPRNSNLGHLNRSTHSHDDEELTISRRRRVVFDLPESSSHDGFNEPGSDDESVRDFDVDQWKNRTREEDNIEVDSKKASGSKDSLARNLRREYHSFSFRSWRESEPGQEGNDAIPQAGLDNFGPVEFARVKDRKVIMCSSREDGDDEISSMARRQDKMIDNVLTDDGKSRYALKIISATIVEQDFKMFLQAAMDNAKETYFLTVLEHPNIIKLRAVGQGDFFDPRYFLLLDRLEDTLQDRIEDSWRVQQESLENSIFVWNRAQKLRALYAERLVALNELAGAIEYLHSSNVIYRDLKPENVGFDCRGCVKLFDFGLCREMKTADESAGAYKLTPMTGSLRYMAPEIFNGWPYNSLADSYSFGVLLWEVIALVRAFASYTSNEVKDMVLKYGERPKIKDDWSTRIVRLMMSCWNSSFRKRPSMQAIAEVLQKEINEQETAGVETASSW